MNVMSTIPIKIEQEQTKIIIMQKENVIIITTNQITVHIIIMHQDLKM